MNVVFAGYRRWSYQILENLLKVKSGKWKLSAAITPPSTEANFTNLLIPVLTVDPRKLNTAATLQEIRKFHPRIFLFYGWSWLIPQELYASYTCLILHPSPLPKYRGGSPLQHQIISGEKTSAVTILEVTNNIDAGPVYSQTIFSLSGTLSQIFDRMVTIGTKDTKKVLDNIAHKRIHPVLQNENNATCYKRRKPHNSEITMKDLRSKTAIELYNFIRALDDPYPNAFIKCSDGKKLLLTSTKVAIE